MSIGKYALPVLALVGAAYCGYAVNEMRKVPPPRAPLVPPVSRPKTLTGPGAASDKELQRGVNEGRFVAGSGLVEAQLENVPVGSPVPGIVWEVFAKVGQKVAVGTPLFRLDDREAQSQLKVAKAQLLASQAQLARLQKAPRPEDLPPMRAAVAEADARAKDTKVELERTSRLSDRNVAAGSDLDADRFAHAAALAALSKSKAELARTEAGSWEEDVKVAESSVAQAQAMVEKSEMDLERLTVKAMAPGEVLKVDVRPGQLTTTTWNTPMVVLGDLSRLHVRVDVDEHDLAKFEPNCLAAATPRGRPGDRFELEFVRVEPYVVPKRSLTGDNAERVDTRVLQVIYAVRARPDVRLYVGQQMDVFVAVPDEPGPLGPDAVAASGPP